MVATGDPIEMSDLRGPEAFDQLLRLEQAARQIYLNQPNFVPGRFQLQPYAEEVLSRTTGLKPGSPELADRVAVRMQRGQTLEKLLQGNTPPQVSVAIDEAVLRRVVGGPGVMREQLEHLGVVSELSTIHLGIIPLAYGAHPGLIGTFEYHEIPSGEASVFFEGGQGEEIIASDQAAVRRFRETVEGLMAVAVTGADARAMLSEIAAGL